jgi:uncharacterized protein (DUF302 family)
LGTIPEVRARLEALLKEEGFGILTEIDLDLRGLHLHR